MIAVYILVSISCFWEGSFVCKANPIVSQQYSSKEICLAAKSSHPGLHAECVPAMVPRG